MRTSKGFTLIELMITVAVIAVLAGIAYPSYTAYVTRGKLVEGTAALSEGRVRVEQFFQDNRTYVGAPAPAATTNFTYALTNGTPAASTYTITATGINGAAGFVYTINQNNVKATPAVPTGSGWATSTTCWVAKKGAAC